MTHDKRDICHLFETIELVVLCYGRQRDRVFNSKPKVSCASVRILSLSFFVPDLGL